MTTAAIRDRLITYLTEADDREVRELYAMLKGNMGLHDIPAAFTEEQLAILDERRKSFLGGDIAGLEWRDVHERVRSKRAGQ